MVVRISAQAHRTLKELSRRSGASMPDVLDQAIEEYRRRRFLEGLHADFASLKRKPKAWKQELRERQEWDATLADGLEVK
jgi:hypothetical protein